MSWYTKISSKAKITFKNQKDLKCVASFTGGEDRFDVNRAAIEEHAGSDKRFEKITLFLVMILATA